ncbi:hypothetical protein [Phormidium nigroviride]
MGREDLSRTHVKVSVTPPGKAVTLPPRWQRYVSPTGVTHPTKETGFFDENTSPLSTDDLKNSVSGTACVAAYPICKYSRGNPSA